MNSKFILGFLLFLVVVFSKAPVFEENSPIIKLDQDNFDEETQGFKDKSWVLLFYAPWCPHCNDIQSVYESLQKKHSDKFAFAYVDSEKSLEIKERFGVTQFPTILVVDHQTQLYHKFRGTRQEDVIEIFLTQNYKEFPGIDLPNRPSLFKTLKTYYDQVGTLIQLFTKLLKPIVIGGITVASILLVFTLVDLIKGEKKEKVDINEVLKESEEKEKKQQQNDKKQKQQKKQQNEDKSSSSNQQQKKKQKEKKDQ